VKRNLPRLVFSSALALGHVILFFALMGGHPRGGPEAFSIYLVDFPGSVPVVLFANALNIHTPYSLYLLLVGGTAWWFCIGILISKLFTFFSTKRKILESASQQR
jgi:hypothetical protein